MRTQNAGGLRSCGIPGSTRVAGFALSRCANCALQPLASVTHLQRRSVEPGLKLISTALNLISTALSSAAQPNKHSQTTILSSHASARNPASVNQTAHTYILCLYRSEPAHSRVEKSPHGPPQTSSDVTVRRQHHDVHGRNQDVDAQVRLYR